MHHLAAPLRSLLLLIPLIGLAATSCTQPPTPQVVSYTVARGDTLSKIAKDHGVSVGDLREWNGLSGDAIDVDQVLAIHRGSTPATTISSPRRSRVSSKGPVTEAPTDAPTEPPLVLPDELPCLSAPTSVDGDKFATVGSHGLSWEQAKAALAPFVPRTTSCAPTGWIGQGTLKLDLTVACTGRVASVVVLSSGGLPDELVNCVADRMRFVPFSAHALPDGDTVRYPITFSGR
ncbi:MAG: hypothetical protein ACI9MC_001292 [Kiritimatiellia bacterium]|jgi:hypothetical protein